MQISAKKIIPRFCAKYLSRPNFILRRNKSQCLKSNSIADLFLEGLYKKAY
jgi:hypothetical protein